MSRFSVHRHISPALIVAIVALIAAMSGSAYAAAKITGKQIAKNAISSSHVKDRSLMARDFKKGVIKPGKNGVNGLNGATGAKGDTGLQGAMGATGATGAKGDTGAEGAKGASGEKGEQGERGLNGYDGSNGVDGKDGAPGLDGKDGKDGAPGQNGAPGENGAPGLTAYQLWLRGEDGILNTEDDNHGTVGDFMSSLHGKDGANGSNGVDGKDGAPGQAGKDGERGPEGPQGPKGEPGIPDAVRTMICTKKNGQNVTLGRGAVDCAGASDAMTVYIAAS